MARYLHSLVLSMVIELDAALLVLMRVTGFVFLNDITGRKSIPSIVRFGIALAISACFCSVYSGSLPQITGMMQFCVLAVKEVLVGFVLGFIINLFLSAIIFGGEFIDFEIGLSIAKIYDTQTNVSMAISASLINVLFFLVFFGMNGHLTLIALLDASFDVIGIGSITLESQVCYNLCQMFSQMLLLGLKIAQPILAVMFIVEIGIAVIMRTIPQINIFTINIQLKILLGIFLFLLMIPSLGSLMEHMIHMLFDNLYLAISALATS